MGFWNGSRDGLFIQWGTGRDIGIIVRVFGVLGILMDSCV